MCYCFLKKQKNYILQCTLCTRINCKQTNLKVQLKHKSSRRKHKRIPHALGKGWLNYDLKSRSHNMKCWQIILHELKFCFARNPPQKVQSREKLQTGKNICNSHRRQRANSNMNINGLIQYVLFYWVFFFFLVYLLSISIINTIPFLLPSNISLHENTSLFIHPLTDIWFVSNFDLIQIELL